MINMNLNELLVSQEQIRNPAQIGAMIQFVKQGGLWSELKSKKNYRPISITQFEDNRYMLHDGHHRVLSATLAGKNFLNADEYEIIPRTYNMYRSINIDADYVTPFDPLTEVRLPDFFEFKNQAIKIYKKNPIEGKNFILKNRFIYCKKRSVFTILELAQIFKESLALSAH